LYEYVAKENLIRVHKMPDASKGGQQESFLSFLFGMTAAQAKARYQMELIVPKAPDPYYHYIRVQPKLPQDKGDFMEARLSIYKANSLPAQIFYHQPNGKETVWNFTELKVDQPNIPLQYFQPEQPKGWRTEMAQPKAPASLQPTKIRTNGN
jgi:TIGR03009 family protein